MKNWLCKLGGLASMTVFSLVASANRRAQDVVNVSPETHKVLLENEHVRVLDSHAKPGEKVGMHSHPASVLYYLTDGKLKITYPDGRTEERNVKAGTSAWSEAVTHAVENVGANELHEVHTELKGPTRRAVTTTHFKTLRKVNEAGDMIHDLRHTFAVHVLEGWMRQGKDLRQMMPVLSAYLGHTLLKSTELYLRLVPERFMKPLSTLRESVSQR
jgi:quercetin dioxygenase-like cupin family protein